MLRKNGFDASQLAAIASDFHNAGLTPEEVALMSFAQKISTHANQVSQPDLDDLRSYGLSDEEILDVVLACTARNFFSKTLDSLAAVPDEIYKDLEPELVQALPLGRPFP